jgi:hypothetical protein
MQMCNLNRVVLSLAVAALAACSDDATTGGSGPSLMTTVVPGTVTVGEDAQVSCSVAGFPKAADELTVVVVADPPDGIEVHGDLVTPTVPGLYTLRCSVPEFDVTDTAGASLEVLAGAPTQVVTTLDANTVAVYEETTVRCLVQDALGNMVAETTSFTAAEGVDVQQQTLSATVPGTYAIRCLAEEAGLEEVPADLIVTTAVPAVLTLTVLPDVPVYDLDMIVTIGYELTDAYGNAIEDTPVTVTLPESGLAMIDEEARKFRFAEEGIFTVSAQAEHPFDGLLDTRDLIVDVSGPDIVMPWPERGQTILADGSAMEISGSISDAGGEVVLFEINDQAVSVDAAGNFTTEITPDWGVNVIRAVARDEYGNISKYSPAYAYSTEYVSFIEQDAKGVEEDNGVQVLLGQDFLDDGDHDPSHPDDLATLLELVLSDLDIPALIGATGPIQVEVPLYQQQIDLLLIKLDLEGVAIVTVEVLEGTDIGTTRVTLDAREGGIASTIAMGLTAEEAEAAGLEPSDALQVNLQVNIDIPLTLTYTPLIGQGDTWEIFGATSVPTSLHADKIIVTSDVDIAKVPDQPMEMSIQNLDVELQGLELDPIEDMEITFGTVNLPLIGNQQFVFTLSELVPINDIMDSVLDPLTQQMLPTLIDAFEPILESFAGEVLAGIFDQFEVSTTIDIPDFLGIKKGEPASVDFYTRLSSILFTEDGGQLGLGVGVYSEKGVEREPLGVIQRDGCLSDMPEGFTYDWEQSLGFALKTDTINGFIFAMWWSGYIDGNFDMSGLLGEGALPIPLENMTLDVEMLLAPVLNDCSAKDGIVEVEAGDVLVHLTADMLGAPVDATFYADASAAIFFGASEEGIVVTLGDFKYLEIEVMEISSGLDGILDVKDLLENQMGILLGSLVVGQTFGPIAVPPIEIGSLLPGLPADAALNMVNTSISKEDGYVVVSGDLD